MGGRGLVLVDELADNLVAGVHLVQVVGEHGLLAELVQEGLSLVQLAKLLAGALEQLGNGRVVGQHQTGHAVAGLDVRGLAR